MDTVIAYRTIVQTVLHAYTSIRYAYGDIRNEAIFDERSDRYMVVSVGWQGNRRIHGCLLHIEIIDGKVWIQRDGTEEGVALELVAAGIPKQNIVLGFQSEEIRPFTEFAVK
ncbi:XisI protein [Candidatus Chloroploca sp. Khr17]|uniref:XisI protein n=1 Tax=Candidatus Chloroploca sp. Khr17 TaxID=2496869 RepID=UPI00101C5508|nr:XisI protein [Candidatus Chloroploca sp. Khr17]